MNIEWNRYWDFFTVKGRAFEIAGFIDKVKEEIFNKWEIDNGRLQYLNVECIGSDKPAKIYGTRNNVLIFFDTLQYILFSQAVNRKGKVYSINGDWHTCVYIASETDVNGNGELHVTQDIWIKLLSNNMFAWLQMDCNTTCDRLNFRANIKKLFMHGLKVDFDFSENENGGTAKANFYFPDTNWFIVFNGIRETPESGKEFNGCIEKCIASVNELRNMLFETYRKGIEKEYAMSHENILLFDLICKKRFPAHAGTGWRIPENVKKAYIEFSKGKDNFDDFFHAAGFRRHLDRGNWQDWANSGILATIGKEHFTFENDSDNEKLQKFTVKNMRRAVSEICSIPE
jgi:hypothetical protein